MNRNDLIVSKLKQIRLSKNILQKYVAKELNLSENSYSRIENGNTKLTIDNLYKICNILNCKIEDVLEIEKKCNYK